MNLASLFLGFSRLGVHPFPEHLCTVPNEREQGVADSPDDAYHVVVMLDRRFPVCGTLSKMRPYTARDVDGSTLYGWVDAYGNLADHGERDIHDDPRKVVARIPCDAKFDLRER